MSERLEAGVFLSKSSGKDLRFPLRVFVDPLAPLERAVRDDQGNKTGDSERVLFVRLDDALLVHPDRWDEFQLWINAPDVADHPEVRALFKEPRR